MKDSIKNIRAIAGMNLFLCPHGSGKNKCEGHGGVPVTLKELVSIRAGRPKVEKVALSCGHNVTVSLSESNIFFKERASKWSGLE